MKNKKISLEKILLAKELFWEIIPTTPLVYSQRLSKKYDAEIFLKREDLNVVRSYKIRWAYYTINSLTDKEKKRWVVCASAWNHAQGFAFSCNKLKIKGTVFMPLTTLEQKVYKTKQFWWKYLDVVLIWDNFDEALKNAKEFEKKNKAVFIHPFDDERIIIWQATIWLEIYKQFEEKRLKSWQTEPDFIVCPVWWWWVISGLISVSELQKKKTKIIWSEPLWACSMKKSIECWENSTLSYIDVFVDWAAVWRVWDLNYEICNKYWLEIISCPENRVCSSILEYLKEDWIVTEPAWALSTDALKDLKDRIKGKTVVLIISWWNFDFERLPELKERSLKFEWLKKYFLINFPQRPWALKEFLNCLWDWDDIERFEYLKKSAKATAPVFIGIKTDNKNNWKNIEGKMTKMWFKYNDVTNDDLYFNLLV